MNPQNPNTAARTRAILEDLEAVRENLLALSEDIWLSIDHNDSESLEAGVEKARMVANNRRVTPFSCVSDDESSIMLVAHKDTAIDSRLLKNETSPHFRR